MVVGDTFVVAGRDVNDDEAFEISDLRWDGSTLRFRSRMPSTDHTVDHEMTSEDYGVCRHRYTLEETWTRCDLTSGCS